MPRLSKGELAPGIKARSEASVSSAEARFVLMLSLKKSGVVSDSDAAPFKTFETLCRHQDESKGIFSISPKTLRKHISIGFEGGAPAFQKLLKWLGDPRRQSVTEAAGKARAVVMTNSLQTDAVLEMSARYADLIERMTKLAGESTRASIEFQAHLRVFQENVGHLRRIK